MTRLRQLLLVLAASSAVLTASAQPVFPPQPQASGADAIKLPPMPPSATPPRSPVTFFRQLLAMSPADRTNALANRAPVARARILAKVQEYLMLSPDERELRLRSTDLRWYLIPLFRLDPASRPARLAQIPDDMRDLVKSRLTEWDVLPPPLQEEILANEHALPYFALIGNTSGSTNDPAQQQMAEQLNQFFELTTAEKQQALKTLSEAERVQMENSLKSFAQLSPGQRKLCVRNYARFAGMSPVERADFLKNADRWSKMSPGERQTWRDLVAQVPIWPPAPSDPVPAILLPSNASSPTDHPGVATN